MNQFGVWAVSPWINIIISSEPYSNIYYEMELRKRIDGVPTNSSVNITAFNTSSLFNVSIIVNQTFEEENLN